ncbi:hypothetical protein HanPSC8_Chr01g0014291 [Helianthus annuus]|nr:hypothetical protein HanPSC8_Chr01g0014291 [Helianthus annuus]
MFKHIGKLSGSWCGSLQGFKLSRSRCHPPFGRVWSIYPVF